MPTSDTATENGCLDGDDAQPGFFHNDLLMSTDGPRTDSEFFDGPRRAKSHASTSSDTSRVRVMTRKASPSPKSKAPSLPPASDCTPSSSSPASDAPVIKTKKGGPGRKRKSLPVDLAVSSDDLVPRELKRLRASSATSTRKRKTSSRGSSVMDDDLPPLEIIRSKSSSSFPYEEMPKHPVFQRHWRTDEDGAPGDHFLSSEMVVRGLIKTYKTYFTNPQDPSDTSFNVDPRNPEHLPVARLEYPNTNAHESFILAQPKDKDHYNPIMDLEASLYTIVEHYCTPEQQARFGPIPSDTLSECISAPASRASTPSTSKELPPLRAFKRALNQQDGPAFMRSLHRINALLRQCKERPEGNSLMQAPLAWTVSGLPNKVLMRIIEENYQRTVGPKVPTLRQYEAFSSTVYGELMPSLIDEIVNLTNLTEDKLFLDLGSGVGNVVAQASLQTGCRSFGVELMPAPATIAENVKEQIVIRARMWGLRIGEMELEKGDMLASSRVDELMGKADVVLVDNKVFEAKLNDAIKFKFLDLKEGAIVISLAPFQTAPSTRLTERTLSDFSAIFKVTERPYHSGSVSWGSGGGSYYIHRVDRSQYQKLWNESEVRKEFEAGEVKKRKKWARLTPEEKAEREARKGVGRGNWKRKKKEEAGEVKPEAAGEVMIDPVVKEEGAVKEEDVEEAQSEPLEGKAKLEPAEDVKAAACEVARAASREAGAGKVVDGIMKTESLETVKMEPVENKPERVPMAEDVAAIPVQFGKAPPEPIKRESPSPQPGQPLSTLTTQETSYHQPGQESVSSKLTEDHQRCLSPLEQLSSPLVEPPASSSPHFAAFDSSTPSTFPEPPSRASLDGYLMGYGDLDGCGSTDADADGSTDADGEWEITEEDGETGDMTVREDSEIKGVEARLGKVEVVETAAADGDIVMGTVGVAGAS